MVERRLAQEREVIALARATSITPEAAASVLELADEAPLAHAVRVAELAKRPGVSLAALLSAAGVTAEDPAAVLTAELELKYAGYFERERPGDRLRRCAKSRPSRAAYEEMRALRRKGGKSCALRPRRSLRSQLRGSAPRICRSGDRSRAPAKDSGRHGCLVTFGY